MSRIHVHLSPKAMNDLELAYLSASEALSRFRSRKLSPVELLDAVIARTETVARLINPFADCYFDEAREHAPKVVGL